MEFMYMGTKLFDLIKGSFPSVARESSVDQPPRDDT